MLDEAFRSCQRNRMQSTVAEITRISQGLPRQKAEQLLQFARTLQKGFRRSTPGAAKSGDAKWEHIIAYPHPKPKLAAKLKELERLATEGKDEPMAWDRL